MPKVLVVDDDADVRAILTATMSACGWQVCGAATGREAIQAACDDRPDLVVLDVRMPGVDGVTVARALRSLPATRAVPVVLLTAAGRTPRLLALAESLNLASVVPKPFDAARLPQRLAELLGWEAPGRA